MQFIILTSGFQMYGKPVPIYLNAFMTGRGRPGNGPLDGSGRRSVYLSVHRNFLSPMMLTFDTPSPFSSVVNAPYQCSLTSPHDDERSFVVAEGKRWGESVRGEGGASRTVLYPCIQSISRKPTQKSCLSLKLFLSANQS